MGNIGPQISIIDAFELSHKLAQNFQGSFYSLNAPAHVQDIRTRDMFIQHDTCAHLATLMIDADRVGGDRFIEPVIIYERGMVDANDIRS